MLYTPPLLGNESVSEVELVGANSLAALQPAQPGEVRNPLGINGATYRDRFEVEVDRLLAEEERWSAWWAEKASASVRASPFQPRLSGRTSCQSRSSGGGK